MAGGWCFAGSGFGTRIETTEKSNNLAEMGASVSVLESQDLWDLTDTTVSTTDLKDEELKAHKKEGKAKAILRTNIG